MISCHGGASKAVITRIGNVWKNVRELIRVVVGKQGLSLKKWGMIYISVMYYIIFVVLYCCETWELIAADEAQLHQVEHQLMTICGVKLVDRLSTDVLRDKGGGGVLVNLFITEPYIEGYLPS